MRLRRAKGDAGERRAAKAAVDAVLGVLELVWEPRLGDVAASGELGWLTGPSTSTNHTAKDAEARPWVLSLGLAKAADGHWRVFIDVGTNAPEPVPFAPGFTRMPFGDR